MRYFILAGEASGDLHGSNLIRALQAQDPEAVIQAWGGLRMQETGVEILKGLKELAFMGFVEVIRNLGQIRRNFQDAHQQIEAFKPDVLVLIDYPGFNLRLARWARGKGYKVVYYISPTVWAWKAGRVEQVRQYTDRMICILPFEPAFYASRGLEVSYVGHPSVEVVMAEKQKPSRCEAVPTLALLPGSRVQEIKRILPAMLEAVKEIRGYRIVIAQAPGLEASVYTPYLHGYDVQLLQGMTYDILKVACAALVSSGTATLEAALFGVPQVVCYRAHAISVWLAKRLVNVKYISLVNLILDRPLLPELIQDAMQPLSMREELLALLADGQQREQQLKGYSELQDKLGPGDASVRCATIIGEVLHSGR